MTSQNPSSESVVRILANAREQARTEYAHKIRHADTKDDVDVLKSKRGHVLHHANQAIRFAGGDPCNIEAEDLERLTAEGPDG